MLRRSLKRAVVSSIRQYRRSILKSSLNGNFLLFADPRGGSTWLMQMIQTITGAPIIWEPLDLGRKEFGFTDLGFSWRQHIPETEKWDEAKLLFDKLFLGETIDYKSIRLSKLSELLSSKSSVVKFCRGNLLLPWIVNNYPLTYKPIYMLRHPFAVVSSQLLHGEWDYKFESFDIPRNTFNDQYVKHESFLMGIKTKEEELVAEWCITNQYLLNHEKNNDAWLTLNYEELVVNPKKSIRRVLKDWEVSYDIEQIPFTKQSRTTKSTSPSSAMDKIDNWKNLLDEDQIKRMTNVLEYFAIEAYDANPLPRIIYNYG